MNKRQLSLEDCNFAKKANLKNTDSVLGGANLKGETSALFDLSYSTGASASINVIDSVCPSILTNKMFVWKNLNSILMDDEIIPPRGLNFTSTCLFDPTRLIDEIPAHIPSTCTDVWNSLHVKMPCSSQNVYIEQGQSISRWTIIKRALSENIDSVNAFGTAVNSYNHIYASHLNFNNLFAAIDSRPDYLPLLNKIANLALRLPNLFTKAIPLLRRNQEASLSFTQLQVACLLANAFFCTFPRRNSTGYKSEYHNFPTINFIYLFHSSRSESSTSTAQKIVCLLHYFSRIFESPPKGTIRFTRRCLHDPQDFASSEACIGDVPFGASTSCLIEDARGDTMHVNFANRFLGGGVLGEGCVQEEILCCIKPEIIVGRLFLEVLGDNEAFLIEGAERFSRYSGYASTFCWVGDFDEETEGTIRDAHGRLKSCITVIDAIPFSKSTSQFSRQCIERELNKAYTGFSDILAPYRLLPRIVVSGHWGCGAFNGNKELKALIQLMASTQAGKALAYCTFGEEDFKEEVLHVYETLVSNKCTVGRLWAMLLRLSPTSPAIFRAILGNLRSTESNE